MWVKIWYGSKIENDNCTILYKWYNDNESDETIREDVIKNAPDWLTYTANWDLGYRLCGHEVVDKLPLEVHAKFVHTAYESLYAALEMFDHLQIERPVIFKK